MVNLSKTILCCLFHLCISTWVTVFAQESFSDGPYVFKEGDHLILYRIISGSLEKKALTTNWMTVSLSVATDQKHKAFSVPLKPGLSYELSTYEMPSRLMALSDIEGNFGPFRELLQKAGVIDENLNWSFGEGHLVLTGDFFDRGDMVTEVLWLIYKLEDQAWDAGGQVHFILGNHEIMNLNGDLRYVNDKYEKVAKMVNKNLFDLYKSNTELGQWLRTKNVIEKIGNHLFVHAGLSEKVNNLNLSLEEINGLLRPWYDKYPDYAPGNVKLLMSGDSGLYWYRGYYGRWKPDNIDQVINQTLEQYEVSKVITGHTVVADQISTHYDGKVINIDTPHSEGKSEALLIEGDNYYAIDIAGNKRELFPLREGEKGVKE